jgi:putative membrane protein
MKTTKKKSAVLFVSVLMVFSIGLYSCKDNSDDQDTGLTQQDQNFAKNASAANVAEIEFSRLALQRATSDSLKAFAQAMITDHTTAQKSLDSIAKSQTITLSDSMDVSHRTLLSRLSGLSSFSFDTAYINHQVIDHQATKNLLQNETNNGKNNLLVKYANKNLPIVTKHLNHATRLQTYIRNQPGGGGTGVK